MGQRVRTALGIGLTAIATSQLYTFMLSSPFTARTIVREKGEIEDVKTDLLIAFGTSVAFGVLMGAILEDVWTVIFAVVLNVITYWIYADRGDLI